MVQSGRKYSSELPNSSNATPESIVALLVLVYVYKPYQPEKVGIH